MANKADGSTPRPGPGISLCSCFCKISSVDRHRHSTEVERPFPPGCLLLCSAAPVQRHRWSHRIFQSYATSLPTSLNCIASINQRMPSLETCCGASVRYRRRYDLCGPGAVHGAPRLPPIWNTPSSLCFAQQATNKTEPMVCVRIRARVYEPGTQCEHRFATQSAMSPHDTTVNSRVRM